ncbi:MAG: helix-turn-helix domain-containing protein [Oscillospiraceae bacterium]|nr:helix-turn-helix domain-containing protein [Oscillospiraceae bacterium]
MTLASNITNARKSMHISQEELAKMLDVNQTYISQVERGVRVPTVALLEQIADVLECSVDGLLGRTITKQSLERNC